MNKYNHLECSLILFKNGWAALFSNALPFSHWLDIQVILTQTHHQWGEFGRGSPE